MTARNLQQTREAPAPETISACRAAAVAGALPRRIDATYLEQWPSAPDGWRVACYRGDWAASPAVYYPAAAYDYRTLTAAVRALARLIARRSPDVPRYDALYIIAPNGERQPLNPWRTRIKAARYRPGMYAGQQGERTRQRWERDAIAGLGQGPIGFMLP